METINASNEKNRGLVIFARIAAWFFTVLGILGLLLFFFDTVLARPWLWGNRVLPCLALSFIIVIPFFIMAFSGIRYLYHLKVKVRNLFIILIIVLAASLTYIYIAFWPIQFHQGNGHCHPGPPISYLQEKISFLKSIA